MSEPIFTKLQQQAYDYILSGKNIFLTGPAGTGKSLVIQTFKNRFGYMKTIGTTSTTGISATLIGGTTVHSFLGIGLGQGTVDQLYSDISKRSKVKQRWKKLDVLIIDEISMLSPELFDKLNHLGKMIRKSVRPFGGIQLILSGDFLQLPVVQSDSFCFEARGWVECVDHTVCLSEIVRQTDMTFQEVLNEIRYGRLTQNAKRLLLSRIGVELKNENGILPTCIYTTNASVDQINQSELDKLATQETEFYEYTMNLHFYVFVKNRAHAEEKFKRSCLAPDTLQLCVGAQVMLLVNLDTDAGLANGSRGIVVSFSDELPVVRFLNGEERIIDYYEWEIEEGREKQVRITQLPLKLAWAITVHKCVSERTLVYTEKGIVRIGSLALEEQRTNSTEAVSVKIHSAKGVERCRQIFKGEIERTIVIHTSLGFSLEGSTRHPLFTGQEWKTLPELKEGDSIALQKGTQCFGEMLNYGKLEIDEYVCALLGALTGKNEERDRERLDVLCTQKDTKLEVFLAWCDISVDKIPWVVLQNGRKEQAAFLSGLFDRTGLLYEKYCFFSLTSRSLAKEVQLLFLNHGVVARIETKSLKVVYVVVRRLDFFNMLQGYNTDSRVPWSLEIPGGAELAKRLRSVLKESRIWNSRLLSRISRGKEPFRRRYLEELCILLREWYQTTDEEGIPDVVREVLEMERSGLFFDRIVRIESSYSRVYDMYVPGSHTFIGDGIVNHNSQGTTLDYAEVSLGNLFEYGQGYVALGRVKSLEGLKILDIDLEGLRAHPKALAFYQGLSSI